MQRQGRINKLKQQQPCLHRNAEPSASLSPSFVSSGAEPGESLNYLLLVALNRDTSLLACLGLTINTVAARAKQPALFGLPVYPPLRCRDVMWCVQPGLCSSCSGGRMGQLFLSTRSSWLAAIGHDHSSHMRAHRTVQPPPLTRGLQRRSTQPSSFCKRLIAGHRLRRACMHSRCPVSADTRMRA